MWVCISFINKNSLVLNVYMRVYQIRVSHHRHGFHLEPLENSRKAICRDEGGSFDPHGL